VIGDLVKVRLEIILEVDRMTWWQAQGSPDTRKDVKEYIEHNVLRQMSIVEDGTVKLVEVR
jgi:hypothetical protein